MQTGNFGQVREAYVEARLLFPDEVIRYIIRNIPESSPSILDLGCGTGIGTRQLYKQGVVVTGSDIDGGMIKEARKISPAISYSVDSAHNLPFKDSQFDAVTAFSAFHWFKDQKSLMEIKRVLKQGGQLFAINKNDVAGFRMEYRQKLERFLGVQLPSPKDTYDPVEILRDAGFSDVIAKVFPSKERFSSQGALRHIQSAGVWSEVPAEKEAEATQLMKDHIAEHTENGEAVRDLEVMVVYGTKAQS